MAYLTEDQAFEVAKYAMDPFVEGSLRRSTPIKRLLKQLDESDGMELESIRTSIITKAGAFNSTVNLGYGQIFRCGTLGKLADEIYDLSS